MCAAQRAAPADARPQASSLAGLYVAITRAEDQAQELAQLLHAWGAVPIFYPCIAIAPPADTGPLDAALHAAAQGGFDWLAITSANTVEMVAQRLAALEVDPARLAGIQVAAVGPATAAAVRETLGLAVALVPEQYTAQALAQALALQAGNRVLLPQSAIAEPELAQTLRAAGAAVSSPIAYRTLLAEGGADLPGMLWEGKIDAVTFTSGSTVRYFRKRLARVSAPIAMLQDVCIACIGPKTAAAARAAGLQVHVISAEQSSHGLVEALDAYFGYKRPRPSYSSGQ